MWGLTTFAHAQHVRTPEETFEPTRSTLVVCSPSERDEIKKTHRETFAELRKLSALRIGSRRSNNSASLRLKELQSQLRSLLKNRDPQTCLLDVGLRQDETCVLLSTSALRFDGHRASFKGDPLLNRERMTIPSSKAGLDYVRTWNSARQEYSHLVFLVDRNTQSIVGSIDDKGLNLDQFGFSESKRDVRGHEVVSNNASFQTKSFSWQQLGLGSPLLFSELCADSSAGLDVFLNRAAQKDAFVAGWNPEKAAMTGADKMRSLAHGAQEGAHVGAINVYESGKNIYDGLKFFFDYAVDTQVESPFEPGEKIGYRALIHQSLGDAGKDAFESCLKEICPGTLVPDQKSCGALAATRATACVGGKIAKHFGKEVGDYVVGCFNGTSRQDEGLTSGAESLSACLADTSVVIASAIPAVGVARGASITGQGAYKAVLHATQSLSPAGKKFLRNFAKQSLRLGAGTSVATVDLSLNQLPTSPSDLKNLQTYLTHYLDNTALNRVQREEAKSLLAKVTEARHGHAEVDPRLSREILKQELERAYKVSNQQWYKESLQSDLDQALIERANFQKYLDEGLKPGEKVFWIQQGSLKDLNEKLWDIGGTEYYLMTLDRELGKLLAENPDLGRMVHRNYKDRVVVSKLSPEDFQKKIMDPLRERVATQVSTVKKSLSTTYLWEDYMQDSLRIGHGSSIDDAFLKMNLGKRSFDSWKSATTERRKKLIQTLRDKSPEDSLEKYLSEARQLKDDPAALRLLMTKRGLPASYADELSTYINDLRVADFLPLAKPMNDADKRVVAHSLSVLKKDPSNPLAELPRIESVIDDSWIFQRSRFLKQAQNARYMVATDIQGLGEKGMMAQDKWLADGADPKTLSRIYEQTTKALEGRYAGVLGKVRGVLGSHATIGLYRSGDDALWSLPEMTIEQKNAVDAIFAAEKDMYSAVVDLPATGGATAVADAVHGAREKLFSDKAVLKMRNKTSPR